MPIRVSATSVHRRASGEDSRTKAATRDSHTHRRPRVTGQTSQPRVPLTRPSIIVLQTVPLHQCWRSAWSSLQQFTGRQRMGYPSLLAMYKCVRRQPSGQRFRVLPERGPFAIVVIPLSLLVSRCQSRFGAACLSHNNTVLPEQLLEDATGCHGMPTCFGNISRDTNLISSSCQGQLQTMY